jgi:subtilisin family serine protease
MTALELVNLPKLMQRTTGRPEIIVALIDGPLLMANPQNWGKSVRYLKGSQTGTCTNPDSAACWHGTFVASMLGAIRESHAAAICPGCTLLVRAIFPEATTAREQEPSASADTLAAAIVDSVDAGARVLNMSMGLGHPSCRPEPRLQQAMDYAAQHGVIPVVASGNQYAVGSSALTRHPWTMPVVGCSLNGRPTFESNLGRSGRGRSLRAPGENVVGLGSDGNLKMLRGTSVAAPFVTGTIALLWSEFPKASARDVRLSLMQHSSGPHSALVPPLLNAEAAYQSLAAHIH